MYPRKAEIVKSFLGHFESSEVSKMGIRKGLVYVFRKKQRKELIFDIVLLVKYKRYNCRLGGGI